MLRGGVRTDPCWRLFDDRYTLKDEYLSRGCGEFTRRSAREFLCHQIRLKDITVKHRPPRVKTPKCNIPVTPKVIRKMADVWIDSTKSLIE